MKKASIISLFFIPYAICLSAYESESDVALFKSHKTTVNVNASQPQEPSTPSRNVAPSSRQAENGYGVLSKVEFL